MGRISLLCLWRSSNETWQKKSFLKTVIEPSRSKGYYHNSYEYLLGCHNEASVHFNAVLSVMPLHTPAAQKTASGVTVVLGHSVLVSCLYTCEECSPPLNTPFQISLPDF